MGIYWLHTFKSSFPVILKGLNHAGPGEKYNIKSFISEGMPIYDIASPIMNGDLGTAHIGISEAFIRESVSDIIMIILKIVAGVLVLGGGAATWTRKFRSGQMMKSDN